MSKYTTEVRWICEQAYYHFQKKHPLLPELKNAELNQIIAAGCDDIFWKDSETDIEMNYHNQFPIYDENHRLELCFKIIKHYYTREISAETVGLWKLWLNERMNEIMPYYNQLYESTDIKYNPLYNTEYSRKGNKNESENYAKDKNKDSSRNANKQNVEQNIFDSEKKNEKERQGADNGIENSSNIYDNNGSNNAVNSRNNKIDENTSDKYSDTPQNGLDNVANGRYLTNANYQDKERVENEGSQNSELRHDEGTENKNRNYTANKVENENNKESENRTNVNSGNENITESNLENEKENGVNNNLGEWEEIIKGKIGDKTYAKMIMEYRSAILNIDKMIIDELKDLFFYLW